MPDQNPIGRQWLILEPNRIEKQYWKDIWMYKELFYILAWRDISVRYKQTLIGVAWALIRPLLTMIIFTFIFGRVAKLPSEGAAPYAILVFTGMLPWQFFSSALTGCADSLIVNSNLLTKVYFPRIIVPSAAVITSLIDFFISFVILGGLMIYFQWSPNWHILTLPVWSCLCLAASMGCGLWLAGLNVKYRDFMYIVPFLIQLGLYISPVGFSTSLIPERWRLIYSLNPMVVVIEGFRWAIIGKAPLTNIPYLFISFFIILILLVTGIKNFRSIERNLADII